MNTKLLMTLSAVFMLLAGLVLSFLPKEILGYLNSTPGTFWDTIILQVLGALYFSFGMVNWTSRSNLIGGIYSRPIAIGNLTHFIIGGLALIKAYFSSGENAMLPVVLIYVAFGISFGIVFFRHPVKKEK